MNRSRSAHAVSAGVGFRWRFQRAYASGASAMGVPGWPELAACTASMDSVRMVSMQSRSSVWASLGIYRPGLILLVRWGLTTDRGSTTGIDLAPGRGLSPGPSPRKLRAERGEFDCAPELSRRPSPPPPPPPPPPPGGGGGGPPPSGERRERRGGGEAPPRTQPAARRASRSLSL